MSYTFSRFAVLEEKIIPTLAVFLYIDSKSYQEHVIAMQSTLK